MSKTIRLFAIAAAGLLATAPFAFSQTEGQGQGQAVVTVLPKKSDVPVAPDVSEQAIQVEVNGKQSQVTNWQPFRGSQAGVELVLLIDDGARTSLGREFDDIKQFIQSLPPNVKMSLAYMQNGRAVLSAPFSSDHAKATEELHLPIGGAAYSASPYFCLSDLAQHWPSNDLDARREVLMVSDGVDNYNRRYDPDDPYVLASITDAAKAHLVVYAIYWKSLGMADSSSYANNTGQNLLQEVTQETGGKSFWEGMGNPVSFQPYFDELTRRLRNQYELTFSAQSNGKPAVDTFKLKLSAPGDDVTAPQQVLVTPAAKTNP